MNDKIFESFSHKNRMRNLTMNERYPKKSLTINHKLNIVNKTINTKNHRGISNQNTKSITISEAIKKIEALKTKYNKINFKKQINSKLVYKKILKLKNKYFDENSNTINIKLNLKKNINNGFKIENTDKIMMINTSWNKKGKSNLNNINSFKDSLNDKFQKSNEIKYQITSIPTGKSKENVTRNALKKNNNNIRDEFLNLDKKINDLLNNDNINKNDSQLEDELLYKHKRLSSVCPIKDRIILLTDVKNKIKKINKDSSFRENDKTQNSDFSGDSQIALGFKYIKPVIKKQKFYEDYLQDDKPKRENEHISRPILIRSLPRPKLGVPNYPYFFNKDSNIN